MATQNTPLGSDPETSVMRAETMELLLRALDQQAHAPADAAHD